jgi:hypothetical protein
MRWRKPHGRGRRTAADAAAISSSRFGHFGIKILHAGPTTAPTPCPGAAAAHSHATALLHAKATLLAKSLIATTKTAALAESTAVTAKALKAPSALTQLLKLVGPPLLPWHHLTGNNRTVKLVQAPAIEILRGRGDRNQRQQDEDCRKFFHGMKTPCPVPYVGIRASNTGLVSNGALQPGNVPNAP